MTSDERDPYELKLFQMFQSCDVNRDGYLNEESLRSLCMQLELRDNGSVLIEDLLNAKIDQTPIRVSFDGFKEALLKFLAELELKDGCVNVTNTNLDHLSGDEKEYKETERTLIIRDDVEPYIDSPPESSDREVSPKFVVGSKKYGRRSRPQTFLTEDLSQTDSDTDNKEEEYGHRHCNVNNQLVQRSTSHTDIPGNRRRRPVPFNGSRLKRCASLPAQKNLQSQMRPVLASKTSCKSAQTSQNLTVALLQQHSSAEYLELPAYKETLSASEIIDIWENAHINNAKNILSALGLEDEDINLLQLKQILEEEFRTIDDDQQQSIFLRASLALHARELKTFRQLLGQLHSENVKLQADNRTANQRNSMLAIEIDERHTALEECKRKEIRQIEQRHNATIRELTQRMTLDRENWTNSTARLDAQIKTLEQNEIKLKTELELIRRDNEELEGEQHKLQKQITEVLEQNIQLNRQLADIDYERPKEQNSVDECENKAHDDDEILNLLEKISALQIENTHLRDKNDELVVEIESLNFELQRFKLKFNRKSATSTTSIETTEQLNSLENEYENGVGATAIKRRGDSPSKTRITEESPRLGKLRKCIDTAAINASENSDTSGEWLALNSELANTEVNVEKLQQRIKLLEEELKKKPQTPSEERCKELEASLEQMQRAYEDCEDYWQKKLNEERQSYERERHIYEDEQLESDRKFTELMEKVREYEEQYAKDGRLTPIDERDALEQQYLDLEAELEEIRENARRVLEEKNKEAEQLKHEIDDLRIRLGESVEILTGANELNKEAEALRKSSAERETRVASSPISYLWHQSTIQEPMKNIYDMLSEENLTKSLSALDTSTNGKQQAMRNNLSTSKTSIFSTPSETQTTSSTSNAIQTILQPIQKPSNNKTINNNNIDIDDADGEGSTTSSVKSFDTPSTTSTQSGCGGNDNRNQLQIQHQAKLNSSNDTTRCSSPSVIKDELKRLKFFEISLKERIKDLTFQRDGLVMELQQLHEAKPVLEKAYARTAHPTLIQRVNQLELKNRHLQNVVKQQQAYSESLMQQSWSQHQLELSELHNRLETQSVTIADQSLRLQNSDILVKELYVENSHLSATIQRMEQQRTRATLHQQQQFLHQQQHSQQQQQQYTQLDNLNILPGMP